uniref:Uncharacterized protein n=1 Tax=Solanum tuberosum TaxID=4113 RepID=M1DWX3_SOLTU
MPSLRHSTTKKLTTWEIILGVLILTTQDMVGIMVATKIKIMVSSVSLRSFDDPPNAFGDVSRSPPSVPSLKRSRVFSSAAEQPSVDGDTIDDIMDDVDDEERVEEEVDVESAEETNEE